MNFLEGSVATFAQPEQRVARHASAWEHDKDDGAFAFAEQSNFREGLMLLRLG